MYIYTEVSHVACCKSKGILIFFYYSIFYSWKRISIHTWKFWSKLHGRRLGLRPSGLFKPSRTREFWSYGLLAAPWVTVYQIWYYKFPRRSISQCRHIAMQTARQLITDLPVCTNAAVFCPMKLVITPLDRVGQDVRRSTWVAAVESVSKIRSFSSDKIFKDSL